MARAICTTVYVALQLVNGIEDMAESSLLHFRSRDENLAHEEVEANPKIPYSIMTASQLDEGWGGKPNRILNYPGNSNYGSGTCTHTNSHKGAWWQVKMSKVMKVSSISLTNRNDCCTDRLNNFNILVGGAKCQTGQASFKGSKTFACSGTGDTIKIQLAGTNYLTICGFEAYGEEVPAICKVSAPANGHLGDCNTQLASGDKCKLGCNTGYTISGLTSCSGGKLTAAKCVESSCDKVVAPQNGKSGNCGKTLASGKSCKPACNSNYQLDGVSTCDKGVFTPATCKEKPCSGIKPPKDGAMGNCPATLAAGDTCVFSCNDPLYEPSDETSCSLGKVNAVTCKSIFDCQAGLKWWYLGWSDAKKKHCCVHGGKLCDGDPTYLFQTKVGNVDVNFVSSKCDKTAGKWILFGDIDNPASDFGSVSPTSGKVNGGSVQVGSFNKGSAGKTGFSFDLAQLSAWVKDGKFDLMIQYGGTQVYELCRSGFKMTGGQILNNNHNSNSAVTGQHGMFGSTSDKINGYYATFCAYKGSCGSTGQDYWAFSSHGVYPNAASNVPCGFYGFGGAWKKCNKGDDQKRMRYYVRFTEVTETPCQGITAPKYGTMGDCGTYLASGDTCKPACNAGYMLVGTSSCTKGKLTAATCKESSCKVVPPAYGSVGNCGASLASGKSCKPSCNKGYTLKGEYKCFKATMTGSPTCTESPCTFTAPADGGKGNCPTTLKSGASCAPSCNTYYYLVGQSSCSKGTLTSATCPTIFMCNEGLKNWAIGWSAAKQAACCNKNGVVCK